MPRSCWPRGRTASGRPWLDSCRSATTSSIGSAPAIFDASGLIDEYRDPDAPTVRERLQRFRSVCSAIQYVHQNVVVHRDIKFGDIPVTAGGSPKLMDSGIAEMLESDPFAQRIEHTAPRSDP